MLNVTLDNFHVQCQLVIFPLLKPFWANCKSNHSGTPTKGSCSFQTSTLFRGTDMNIYLQERQLNFTWQIFSRAVAHFQPRTVGTQLSPQHAWTRTTMNHLGLARLMMVLMVKGGAWTLKTGAQSINWKVRPCLKQNWTLVLFDTPANGVELGVGGAGKQKWLRGREGRWGRPGLWLRDSDGPCTLNPSNHQPSGQPDTLETLESWTENYEWTVNLFHYFGDIC